MAQLNLYRNVRARGLLELFLLSAISSLLLVRFYLHITGYPQIGSGGLHVAHMLIGGLLMLSGIIVNFAFLGFQVQRLSAFLSGVGFGIFIDEIGKFITSDNNYFFQPAVGIIYAIFVSLYLLFNFLSRHQTLTSQEYQLNALSQLEEAVLRDMDAHEKSAVLRLLQHADQRSLVTKQLTAFINDVQPVRAEMPGRLRRLIGRADEIYTRFWQRQGSNELVRDFFVVQTTVFLGFVAYAIYNNVDDLFTLFMTNTNYGQWLLVGQLISSVVAAGFALYGAVLLRQSRLHAFEQFRRATLVNLFLTEFFIFSRIEFAALPGLLFNVTVLLLITYVIHHEHHHSS